MRCDFLPEGECLGLVRGQLCGRRETPFPGAGCDLPYGCHRRGLFSIVSPCHLAAGPGPRVRDPDDPGDPSAARPGHCPDISVSHICASTQDCPRELLSVSFWGALRAVLVYFTGPWSPLEPRLSLSLGRVSELIGWPHGRFISLRWSLVLTPLLCYV